MGVLSTKAKDERRAEALAYLRKLLRPGDRVYTVLRHVSSSGMSRRIDLYYICRNEPVYLTGYVAAAMDERVHRDGGMTVGGCGMDMDFHVVHSLGYALWGAVASKGKGRAATSLRKRLAVACRSYLCQGGASLPDVNVPGQEWFGATGYALNHSWL